MIDKRKQTNILMQQSLDKLHAMKTVEATVKLQAQQAAKKKTATKKK